MTHPVTIDDLRNAVERYANICTRLGLVPEGSHIGLDEGSQLYGRACRLYVTGNRADDGTYPNGSGHSRPPLGDDYLGMTKRDAYHAIQERISVLHDLDYLGALTIPEA